MEYKDYYKILGIERTAGPDQIKQAYRKLALKYHPDHNPGDKGSEEKFKEINEANQVLSDPEKRSRYDSLGENYANYQQRGGAPGGFNWEDWYSTSQGSGANFNVGDLNDLFGGGFSEFFTRIFGGTPDFGRTTTFNPGTQRVRMPKPSLDQEVEINLQEAYQGALRKLEIEGRRLEVKIPPGSRTGTRVRVADILPTTSQGQKGDLYLVIRVLEDKQFKRTGDDLITEIPVELANVVLGGAVTVDTLSGKVVLTIPAGTQPGQSFRLAGRGMPHLKNPKVFGDLIAQVKIQIPRNLTPDQRQKFEDFTRSLRP